ncbi:hypothetical protein H8F25_04945 [Synechococcus sp. CBW1004]|nr:hypothetical protein H8F25_04945 [Synechococcus sp. CBW1004]
MDEKIGERSRPISRDRSVLKDAMPTQGLYAISACRAAVLIGVGGWHSPVTMKRMVASRQ